MAKTDDPQYDFFSDPDNPRKIEFDGILAASKRMVGQIVRTPCSKAQSSSMLGMELYLKQEFLQYTGSFKERGIRNTLLLLSDEQKKIGVIAATTGNHGCAVSYHATSMGIPSIVAMPFCAPVTKIKKCERLGAKIVMVGANIDEAKTHALAIAKETKMLYINGFDHPNVIEGQGTVGIEIIEQVPEVEAVIVPVGGGSLLSGTAVAIKHLKPDVEVYGIETDKTCSMTESIRRNERIFFPMGTTIADGLAVPKVGVNSLYTIVKGGVVDKMVVVKEDWVARAITQVAEQEKFVCEGAGCTAFAGIMAGLFPNLKGKKVVIVCTGGNIDTTTLTRALERGMAAEGRLIKFKVTVVDRPGGMAQLCSLLASVGVTLRDCVPERAWVKGDVFSCDLKVIVETKGWPHAKEMVEAVKKHFKQCYFPEMSENAETTPGTRRGPCLAPNPLCMQK